MLTPVRGYQADTETVAAADVALIDDGGRVAERQQVSKPREARRKMLASSRC